MSSPLKTRVEEGFTLSKSMEEIFVLNFNQKKKKNTPSGKKGDRKTLYQQEIGGKI